MIKNSKILWASILILLCSLFIILTGCSGNKQTKTHLPNAIDAKKTKQENMHLTGDLFKKIATYLKDNGNLRENTYFLAKSRAITKPDPNGNSTIKYSSYAEIAYSYTTDSLILRGIANKGVTAITIEIPNLIDYTNYTYTYRAYYVTKNNLKKDVTLEATFKVPAQYYTSTKIPTIQIPELEFDEKNKLLTTAIGRDKLINFKKTLPNAIEQAETQLNEVCTNVIKTSNNITFLYKQYFCLPTFENPLAFPVA